MQRKTHDTRDDRGRSTVVDPDKCAERNPTAERQDSFGREFGRIMARLIVSIRR